MESRGQGRLAVRANAPSRIRRSGRTLRGDMEDHARSCDRRVRAGCSGRGRSAPGLTARASTRSRPNTSRPRPIRFGSVVRRTTRCSSCGSPSVAADQDHVQKLLRGEGGRAGGTATRLCRENPVRPPAATGHFGQPGHRRKQRPGVLATQAGPVLDPQRLRRRRPDLPLPTRRAETSAPAFSRYVRAWDWEDMASFTWQGKHYLLLGDVGNNGLRRPGPDLHLVAEPPIDPAQGVTARESRSSRRFSTPMKTTIAIAKPWPWTRRPDDPPGHQALRRGVLHLHGRLAEKRP